MSEIHVSVQNTPIEVTAAIENPIDITVASGPASSNLDSSQFLTTGDAFNLYYRNSNPSGFVSSLDAGSVLSINNLSGVLQITGLGNVIVNHDGQIIQISGAESINHIFTGDLIKYNVFLTSGVETEFIDYPVIFIAKPSSINCEFENDRDNLIYSTSISGISTNGFYINYSDILSNTGYKLNITVNK